MAEAFETQVGGNLEGIVASPIRTRSAKYVVSVIFKADTPPRLPIPFRRLRPFLNRCRLLTRFRLAIFMISGGGSSVVEKPVAALDDENFPV